LKLKIASLIFWLDCNSGSWNCFSSLCIIKKEIVRQGFFIWELIKDERVQSSRYFLIILHCVHTAAFFKINMNRLQGETSSPAVLIYKFYFIFLLSDIPIRPVFFVLATRRAKPTNTLDRL
jgi:hypothetical protein